MTTSLVSATAVFWLAHVWAAIVDERLRLRGAFALRRVRELARKEWPIVEAGFVPAVPLAFGWAGALADDTAANLALALALLDLVGWGFVVGRREASVGAAVVSAAVTTALGLLVVALEVLIH